MTLFLLRAIPRLRATTQPPNSPPSTFQKPSHQEAVLLIQEGGRVAYLNTVAHQWFDQWEEEPNLERLARRARPSEDFLRLCASESQARLSLDGRFVDGTSYFAPFGAQRAMLVSLRQPQWLVDEEAGEKVSTRSDASRQIFGLLSELSQEINASLDLETTLQAVLEAVERLIPFDISEVNIWEPDKQRFIPFRLVGEHGSIRRLEKTTEFYTPGQGYTGRLADSRTPLLIDDVEIYREVRPAFDRQRIPFRSYLGAPLLLSGELIGTLELISFNKSSFSTNDLEILRVISGYAAAAVHNALQFKAEQKRARELAGLANLAHAIGALNDSQDLYARLVESIAPLLNVEVLGFLVYDETQQSLDAKAPFLGLPEGVVAWYHTKILADSPAEKIWLNGEAIFTNNAPEDARLENLGLHQLAQVAGIRHTVLTPLFSAGRMLGYLQIGDKRDGSPFDQDDLRLATIIATQAAPIIENASLILESRRRAQRAETLRRIASLSGSNATLDEILKFSLLDLARLIQADVALIYLLDEDHGELRLHKNSLFGIQPDTANRLLRFPVDDPQFPNSVTASKLQFVSGKISESGGPALYRPLVEVLRIESVIDVPLIARERGVGEILLGSFEGDFFVHGDTLSAATVASQLAAAIERSELYSQSDQNLRQRVEQLTALTRISREINTTLNLDHLLQRVYDEVLRTTRADCGTILLFELDETSASPASPQVMLHLGDNPSTRLHPLEEWVLKEKESLIVADFKNSENPILKPQAEITERGPQMAEVQPAHEGIRSALIVPIAYQGQVAGLIHLHAQDPDHFSTADREISETLAIQAAIALGNAQRFREQMRRSDLLNRRVETLSRLVETSHVLQSEESLEESLESIAYAVQSATPFDIVLISVYNLQDETLQRVSGAGIPLQTMGELRERTQAWKSVQELLKLEFRRGDTYFIPGERMPAIPEALHSVTLMSGVPSFSNESTWRPEDILLMPLIAASGQPLGLISVDAPRDNLRPDRPTIETLEIFGSQAAIAIENRQKVSALSSQLSQIQCELERLREEAKAAQEQHSALLQNGQEQDLAIQYLSQRSRRIQAGLEIGESVSRKTDRQEVLAALGQEILDRMRMDITLVAELGSDANERLVPKQRRTPQSKIRYSHPDGSGEPTGGLEPGSAARPTQPTSPQLADRRNAAGRGPGNDFRMAERFPAQRDGSARLHLRTRFGRKSAKRRHFGDQPLTAGAVCG